MTIKNHLLISAAFLFAASPASAEGLSGTLTLVSNYKTWGQDQTQNKPAIQGGFEYHSANGLYVGNWNSSVSWAPEVSIETDIYGGYNGTAAGFNYGLGVYRYGYPGYSVANTVKLFASIGHSGLEMKYFHTVSSQFFNLGTKASYTSLSYKHNILDTLTAQVGLGRTDYFNNAAAELPDYTDFRFALELDIGDGYSISGVLAGANKREVHGDANRTRFILGLTKSF
jgi:uncharacterized protein (TIGR02001 family)